MHYLAYSLQTTNQPPELAAIASTAMWLGVLQVCWSTGVEDAGLARLSCCRGFEMLCHLGLTCGCVRAGDTFTDGSVRYTMTSMNVPDPVMSLSVTPASKDVGPQVN